MGTSPADQHFYTQPGSPVSQSAHGRQAPKRKRGAGKTILLVVAAVVGIIVVIAGIGAALSGGGDSTGAAASDTASSAGDAAGTSKATTKKAAPSGPGIGDKARDGKFEFVVTKVTSGKTKVGDEYLNKKAQGVFVFVYVTVSNVGDEAQLFDGSSQILYDAKGRKFSSDGEAGIYLDDSQSFLNEINPGNKVKGIVVFDVPKGTKGAKIELHDSPFSGGVDVTLQ